MRNMPCQMNWGCQPCTQGSHDHSNQQLKLVGTADANICLTNYEIHTIPALMLHGMLLQQPQPHAYSLTNTTHLIVQACLTLMPIRQSSGGMQTFVLNFINIARTLVLGTPLKRITPDLWGNVKPLISQLIDKVQCMLAELHLETGDAGWP